MAINAINDLGYIHNCFAFGIIGLIAIKGTLV